MLNWQIDELAFVELVICLTDFCSAQMWWNLHFDELTFDELTFCSVGFDQFSLLNFFCLVDMEPNNQVLRYEWDLTLDCLFWKYYYWKSMIEEDFILLLTLTVRQLISDSIS